jgi:hypothetical protein
MCCPSSFTLIYCAITLAAQAPHAKQLPYVLHHTCALMAAVGCESDDSWAPSSPRVEAPPAADESDDSWAPLQTPVADAAAPASADESDGSWAPSQRPVEPAPEEESEHDEFLILLANRRSGPQRGRPSPTARAVDALLLREAPEQVVVRPPPGQDNLPEVPAAQRAGPVALACDVDVRRGALIRLREPRQFAEPWPLSAPIAQASGPRQRC